jgi:hypothetical protein
LRQSIGEFLPRLHNCGEESCPFTEPPAYLRRLSLETGQPLPADLLSPGDHIRVDKRAFTKPTHVKVKLHVLGFDSGMWGDLEYFSGFILDHYYQEVTGAPMFSVQFGGSVGTWEVKVCDTVLDEMKMSVVGVQHTLHFASSSSKGAPRPATVMAGGPSGSTSSPAEDIHPMHPTALLVYDSDDDLEWVPQYEDFEDDVNGGMSPYLRSL